MKSIVSAFAAFLTLASLNSPVMAQSPDMIGTKGGYVQMREQTYLGCYKSPGDFVDFGTYEFQARGFCQPLCVRQAKRYMAFTNGTNCLCSDNALPDEDKVDDNKCNLKCKGFGTETCGGLNFFAAWDDGYQLGDNTGTLRITSTPAQSALAAFAQKTKSPTDTVFEASTIFVTQPGAAKNTASANTNVPSGDTGPNKAAIAGGVVVGIVALSAIVGGLIFFIRRKKQKEREAERQRHETITNFVTKGEKPPSTHSFADSRLEPSVMFQRRQSDISIMDNQDYSRRILKVTNPDDR